MTKKIETTKSVKQGAAGTGNAVIQGSITQEDRPFLVPKVRK